MNSPTKIGESAFAGSPILIVVRDSNNQMQCGRALPPTARQRRSSIFAKILAKMQTNPDTLFSITETL